MTAPGSDWCRSWPQISLRSGVARGAVSRPPGSPLQAPPAPRRLGIKDTRDSAPTCRPHCREQHSPPGVGQPDIARTRDTCCSRYSLRWAPGDPRGLTQRGLKYNQAVQRTPQGRGVQGGGRPRRASLTGRPAAQSPNWEAGPTRLEAGLGVVELRHNWGSRGVTNRVRGGAWEGLDDRAIRLCSDSRWEGWEDGGLLEGRLWPADAALPPRLGRAARPGAG